MKKIDVIIPVFNTNETLLRNCIESCIKQTKKFNSIIVIDDGSSLITRNILKEYSNYIKLFFNENHGLAYTRNYGVKCSTGDYYMFLDSDDYLELSTVATLNSYIEKDDYDIIIFSTIQRLKNRDNAFKYKIAPGVYLNEDAKNLKWHVLNFDENIATAWGKLINSKFTIENNIYHNASLRQGSEGIEFCFRLFNESTKVRFLDSRLYNYVYNLNSISANYNKANDLLVINCFQEILKQVPKEKCINVYNRFSHVIISTVITGIVLNEKYTKKEKKQYIDEYLNYSFVKLSMKYSNNKNMSFGKKIAYFACKKRMYFVMSVMGRIRMKMKRG